MDDVDPISGRYHTCVYLKQTMSFILPPLSESLVFYGRVLYDFLDAVEEYL